MGKLNDVLNLREMHFYLLWIMNSCLSVPSSVVVGENALSMASDMLCAAGNNALVVTGRHVLKTRFASLLFEVLHSSGIKYHLFDGITGEPTDRMIDDGYGIFMSHGCDFCIGLGGGSPIDAAKLIALKVACSSSFSLYSVPDMDKSAIPPIVAVPTTAGTGSEVTRYAVATDTENDRKLLVSTPLLLPALAIVDYRAGLTTPPSVKASSGIDALTHAIEAYISRKSNPVTDDLAAAAVRRITKNIVSFVMQNDAEAGREMAVAALEAGICINNSSVTLVHGMSRPIGALFHVPHGLSNAMLLPVCLKDMAVTALPRLSRLSKQSGIADDNDGEDVAVGKLLDSVNRICSDCRIPSMREYGVEEADFLNSIDKMSSDAIASGSPSNAPGSYTAADCRRLYLEAYYR